MKKQDLALNNQQWLICHKNKPNQTIHLSVSLRKKTKTGRLHERKR